MDYEQYEAECERIRKENNEFLNMFKEYLSDQKLSDKTIRRHLGNVDLYINDFLLYYDANPMEKGAFKIGEFLGDFFIRKCMWSTPGSIKSTAASIKKFYKCMLEHNKVSREDYAFLCDEIKYGMEDWQMDCGIYNDPDEPNPFMFF